LREKALRAIAIAAQSVDDPRPFYRRGGLEQILEAFSDDDTFEVKISMTAIVIALLKVARIAVDETAMLMASEAFRFVADNAESLAEATARELADGLRCAEARFSGAGRLGMFFELLGRTENAERLRALADAPR